MGSFSRGLIIGSLSGTCLRMPLTALRTTQMRGISMISGISGEEKESQCTGGVLSRKLVVHNHPYPPGKCHPSSCKSSPASATLVQQRLPSHHQDCWTLPLTTLRLINTCTNVAAKAGHVRCYSFLCSAIRWDAWAGRIKNASMHKTLFQTYLYRPYLFYLSAPRIVYII